MRRGGAWLVAALLVALLALVAQRALHRATTLPYHALALPRVAVASSGNSVRGSNSSSGVTITAVFAGVATVLLDDGVTAVLTDGFFTRPPLWQLVVPRARIAPNRTAVERAVQRLMRGRTSTLAAVVPIHAHYDHAMDAPLVAELTGAVVLGSAATAQIARGHGLPEERIRTAPGNATTAYRFGAWEITLVPGVHSRRALLAGDIDAPVMPPAPVSAYRMGDCYSVVVQHTGLGRAILIHGSPNYIEGALDGHRADVVFLGSVGLSAWGEREPAKSAFRAAYWREVVAAVGARRVLPIHWDDFTSPLPGLDDADGASLELLAMPAFTDEFDETMADLQLRGRHAGVDVRFPIIFDEVDPFHGLPPLPLPPPPDPAKSASN